MKLYPVELNPEIYYRVMSFTPNSKVQYIFDKFRNAAFVEPLRGPKSALKGKVWNYVDDVEEA